MKKEMRNFVKIVKEVCAEENIDLEAYSYNWIFRLHKKGVYNYIIGHQFGLNTCSVHSICCDKCAASEIMTSFDIPNVEHYFFMSPTNLQFVSTQGNWEYMLQLLKKFKKLVCKTNEGTGGNQVFLVSNPYELENAVFNIFKNKRSMAISPYYEVENEYRTIVLDGKVKLIYTKQRPYIIGDGVHTICELLMEYVANNNKIKFKEIEKDELKTVLKENEIYYLNWKHNLGQGACAQIEVSSEIKAKISNIVKQIVDKMNIRFASIDIINCNNEFKVLEINSGVMMEHFSQQDESKYQIAKEIYREAILHMLK